MNTTMTRDAKRVSKTLNQCQAELSDVLLNSIENQREEVAGIVQQGYDTVKQKAQQFLEKGAKAQEKLGNQVSDYSTKLETAAQQLPNQATRTVVSYPWVALGTALVLGAIIAWLLKPSFTE